MRNRWLAWFLCLMILLTALPAAASAVEAPATGAQKIVQPGQSDNGMTLIGSRPNLKYKKTTRIALSNKSVTMYAGERYQVAGEIYYVGRGPNNTLFTSNKPKVASVGRLDGVITAKKPGTVKITVKSGNKSARLTVNVLSAPQATSVTVNPSQAELTIGEGMQLGAEVYPSNADPGVYWFSSNPSVVSVTKGYITAKKAGSANIYATADNGVKGSCQVQVTSSIDTLQPYHSLVVGMSRATVMGRYRLSALPFVDQEVRSVSSMLWTRALERAENSAYYSLNQTRAQVFRAIDTAFKGSRENSVNYLYTSSHGGQENGEFMLALGTDAFITARELRSALDAYPGRFVVIICACESGAVIKKDAAQDFAKGFARQFASGGTVSKSGELIDNKYEVITACLASQNAWGISDRFGNGYDFFAKALLEGMGWDVERNRDIGQWKADADGDGNVTTQELYIYSLNGVNELMDYWRTRVTGLGSARQTVAVYPENSGFVVFAK